MGAACSKWDDAHTNWKVARSKQDCEHANPQTVNTRRAIVQTNEVEMSGDAEWDNEHPQWNKES